MPGKTMIGGTAYDVKPGSVMVGGTVYTIKEGKTMVGGTAYSIKFASDVVVTITGKGTNSGQTIAYVEISGTQYTSAETVTIPAGTEIYCYAKINFGSGGVYLNETNLNVSNYTFNAESDVSIVLSTSGKRYGTCKITTT